LYPLSGNGSDNVVPNDVAITSRLYSDAIILEIKMSPQDGLCQRLRTCV